jgi:RNA polymerase sigma-70 factor (ECF subfamily)
MTPPGAIGSALPIAVAPPDLLGLLERSYRAHKDEVFKIALRYGGGRQGWAEDVVQDVFLALGRALPGLEDTDDLMGWLYRVTTRRCLRRLESERVRALFRWRTAEESAEPQAPESDAITAARTDLARAFRALEQLPPKERVAFAMHRLDGATMEQIGAVLGHKKSYVCRLIARAEARLREVLT